MGEPVARSRTATLTLAEGAALARFAATAVAHRLTARHVRSRPPESAALCAVCASFVTLQAAGVLRGCIGSLEPVRPLYLDVARNAVRAMSDPRMTPVTIDEWPKLDIGVSVLTRPEPSPATSRYELLAALRPGLDGLILTDGVRRATLLPAVWQKLPEPAAFLDALLQKGGWGAGQWPAGMRAACYRAAEFHDPAPRIPLRQPPMASR